MADAALIRLMREASGMGMMDCREAARVAEEELGGDYVVALLARDAAALAVMVRSRDPAVTDRKARRRWNLAHAVEGRAGRIERGGPAWAELDRRSRRAGTDEAETPGPETRDGLRPS